MFAVLKHKCNGQNVYVYVFEINVAILRESFATCSLMVFLNGTVLRRK